MSKSHSVEFCQSSYESAKETTPSLTVAQFAEFLMIDAKVKPYIVGAWIMSQRERWKKIIDGDSDLYTHTHTADYPHPEKEYPFTKE